MSNELYSQSHHAAQVGRFAGLPGPANCFETCKAAVSLQLVTKEWMKEHIELNVLVPT